MIRSAGSTDESVPILDQHNFITKITGGAAARIDAVFGLHPGNDEPPDAAPF